MGDVVNLSARLMTCRHGAPGVVIDRYTYVACRNSAEAGQVLRFEEMEPLSLKGMSKPVQAYLVNRAPRASTVLPDASLARATPKVSFICTRPLSSCLRGKEKNTVADSTSMIPQIAITKFSFIFAGREQRFGWPRIRGC